MKSDRAVAEGFVAALAERSFLQVEACFHPRVRFRALVPSGLREGSYASEAAGYLRGWFGDADQFSLLSQDVAEVADRLHLAYRIRLHDADGWQVVEQQAFCDVSDGRIAAI